MHRRSIRGLSTDSSGCALIDADVIDQEAIGERGVVDALLAAPVAAYRDVQEQVLRRVERPRRPAALRLAREREIGAAVDRRLDAIGGPFRDVDVEAVEASGTAVCAVRCVPCTWLYCRV